jgi:acyl-CoA dehydrogenase
MGVSQDTPLAGFYAMARCIRLADGPDEVHMFQLGRNLAKQHEI